MRFLMNVEFSVEAGNTAAKNGTLGKKIQDILDRQKPEAAYFFDSHGRRGGVLVVEMQDAAQIPALAEPWFLALDASVELHAVMVPADLARAAPGITEMAKKYG
jgi:hypothetical protein